jgi:hypothetical protein
MSAAAQTPPSRNRHVDFLRAVSIGAIVLGRAWLLGAIAARDRAPASAPS